MQAKAAIVPPVVAKAPIKPAEPDIVALATAKGSESVAKASAAGDASGVTKAKLDQAMTEKHMAEKKI